jgi:hypothetical protein
VCDSIVNPPACDALGHHAATHIRERQERSKYLEHEFEHVIQCPMPTIRSVDIWTSIVSDAPT